MAQKDDWRRMGQENYLMGIELYKFHGFQPYSERWDHEHCCFCLAKFSNSDNGLHEGYCSTDKERSHWICPQCYIDFNDEFGWSVIEEYL